MRKKTLRKKAMRKKTTARSKTRADAARGQRKSRSTRAFPIVGVGASAGGLDAMQRLLAAVAPRTRLAIVYVQHLDPARESFLVRLLGAKTHLSVVVARDGVRVAAGHVYIAPPHTDVSLRAGVLRLAPRAQRAPVRPYVHGRNGSRVVCPLPLPLPLMMTMSRTTGAEAGRHFLDEFAVSAISAAPMRDDQGRIVGVVVVFHDASKGRRAEAALRRKNANSPTPCAPPTAARTSSSPPSPTSCARFVQVHRAAERSQTNARFFVWRNLRFRRDLVGLVQFLNRCVTHWHFYRFTREASAGRLRLFGSG